MVIRLQITQKGPASISNNLKIQTATPNWLIRPISNLPKIILEQMGADYRRLTVFKKMENLWKMKMPFIKCVGFGMCIATIDI